jgi:tetratricopeptide (TPR) repeat protein
MFAMAGLLVTGLAGSMGIVGCRDNSQAQVRKTQQAISATKTKSDSLQDAMRYLNNMMPLNRNKVELEVQLYLNKWWMTAERQAHVEVPGELLNGLPPDLRSEAEFAAVGDGQFSLWDVEHMYQCRIYRRLSQWIVQRPLQDTLFTGWLDKQSKTMRSDQFAQLEGAFKLFDWSVRNIVLKGQAKDVEQLSDDPRKPVVDSGVGYKYLPWQTALYGRGDFIERGRVFTALAQQRNLQTCWIALRLPTSPSAKLWTVGVWIGDDCYLFDTKLGLPIVDPDSLVPVTLAQVQKDDRILRRLDVPGKFDYAVNPGDAKNVEFLLEIEPSSVTDRMAQLEGSLTGEDRLLLVTDAKPLNDKIKRLYPDAMISVWQVPLLTRLYAKDVRARLLMNSTFTAQYMIEHAIWFMDTPSASARLKHLQGEFESTVDTKSAAEWYMDCRLPDEMLDRLREDPDVAREMSILRMPAETAQEWDMRLFQMQIVLKQAKIDAHFLLGQLSFELGKYDEAISWMNRRTLANRLAEMWHPAARYIMARAYQQQGKLDEAIAAYNADGSPMEAGNRLRVRYLSRKD